MAENEEYYEIGDTIMSILLKDNTTKENIRLFTDNYKRKGYEYADEISLEMLKNKKNILKPRVKKTIEEQQNRARTKAEVFTPSWVCNSQNNLVDRAWFRI